jgi:Flp pilus assembly protein TadG
MTPIRKHHLKLLQQEEGSVIILVAVTIFLFVMLVGVAVDYSRAQTVQARMQSALDAAGLAAMSELRDPGKYR